MRHSGRQVTCSMIFENVWNLTFHTTTNVVDVYIFGRRQKGGSLKSAIVGSRIPKSRRSRLPLRMYAPVRSSLGSWPPDSSCTSPGEAHPLQRTAPSSGDDDRVIYFGAVNTVP